MDVNKIKPRNRIGDRALSSHPNEVLIVNMGRDHEDTEGVKQELHNKYGYKIVPVDLNKKSFSKIDFTKVAAVDLKDVRGWQRERDFFEKELTILQEKIAQTGREIPIINPPEMFSWVASKEYLGELAKEGVPVVPTVFVSRTSVMPDVFAMMNKNPDKRIVLKPAQGSRAADVIFITKKGDDAFDITCSTLPRSSSSQPTKPPTPHTVTMTRRATQNWLQGYREKMLITQHQPAFLVQGYMNAKETSAVFIGEEPHYIDRTRTDETMIAHEDFGGRNYLQIKPSKEVEALAYKVRNSLPGNLSHAPYMRIDIMHDDVNPPLLLEVEAGSSRLFLNESERVEDYARMVHQRVMSAVRKSRLAQQSGSQNLIA